MSNIEATIEIQKTKGALIGLKVVMPVWHKFEADETIKVELPLLNITTTAFSEEDIEVAVNEAVHLFVKSAEKFGRGVERELKELGWNLEKSPKKSESMLFNLETKVPYVQNLIHTGNQSAFKVQFA